jgi:general secretion pathway protein E
MIFASREKLSPNAILSAESTHSPRRRIEALLADTAGSSVVELVATLIEDAYTLRTSDIHIEPVADSVTVRFRIDGVLQDAYSLPRIILPEVISRVKILASLRTDEHQAAQDGRFHIVVDAHDIDVRVSITPTYYGENAVLRLLADNSTDFNLTALGFSEDNQKKIVAAVRRPHGMILATGPTGSGKTTTLYTLVKMLQSKDISIVTIEDPIEYAMPGITQIQMNQRTGLSFANGLRSILRQDPDVIMVGEIRDAETAGIAVNTSLTGHLLLSTLHTNDAATTLPRLLDMGIDAYLVASTVNIAIGQRLVRRLCPDCKKKVTLTDIERTALTDSLPARLQKAHKSTGNIFYENVGCASCDNTGFNGRVGLYEVLTVTPAVRDAILKKSSATVIRDIAIEEGMTTMFEDGLGKALAGETTIREVLRTINE